MKLNLNYNSSWALFTADKEVAPEVEDDDTDFTYQAYAFSGFHYTFESSDKRNLDQIRTWNRDYFAKNLVITSEMYTPLDEAINEEGDFNVLGKVTQILHRDHYTSDIRIRDDSGETWFATILRRQFPRVLEGEVVKIRSVTVERETSRVNAIKLAPHSNIMTIVPFSEVRKNLKKSISMDQTKVDKEILKQEHLFDPVLASTVSKKLMGTDVSTLEELFTNPDNDSDTFRARFYVVKATSGKDTV